MTLRRRTWYSALPLLAVALYLLVARGALASAAFQQLTGLMLVSLASGRLTILAPLADARIVLSPWQLIAPVLAIDLVLSAWTAINADLLERLPLVGPALRRTRDAAIAGFHRGRKQRRSRSAALLLFVLVPMPGTGPVGGAMLGRYLGLERARTVALVMLGGTAGAVVTATAGAPLTALLSPIEDSPVLAALRLAFLLVILLAVALVGRHLAGPATPPRPRRPGVVPALAAVLALAAAASAGDTVTVGTRHVPPFAIQAEDGSWSGLSIELWRELANELELEYGFEERTLEGLLEGLEDGSLDVVAAALTITAERERRVDFTHAYHHAGLGVATGVQHRRAAVVARLLLRSGLLQAIGALASVLALAALAVWLFERKRNPEQFGGGAAHGLAASFWWAAVTMTTVGYGDKAPRSVGGRAVAIIWMFTSLIIVSGFIASIASAFTVAGLQSDIDDVDDLLRLRLATADGTTAALFLERRGLPFQRHEDVAGAIVALGAGEVDAVVYDAPVLRYLARQAPGAGLQFTELALEEQSYGLAVPAGSPLREELGRRILRIVREPGWRETEQRYLGGP